MIPSGSLERKFFPSKEGEPEIDRRLAHRHAREALRHVELKPHHLKVQGPFGLAARKLAVRRVAVRTEAMLRRAGRRLAKLQGERKKPLKADVDSWAATMRRRIGTAHMASARLALGGHKPDKHDDAVLKREVARQLQFFDNFVRQVRAGKVPPERLGNRAGLYGSATWGTGWNVARARAARAGDQEGRRRLGIAEHCNPCVEYAEQGWMPADALPPLGDTPCKMRCACWYEFRPANPDAPQSELPADE